jgi:hypothetical protein
MENNKTVRTESCVSRGGQNPLLEKAVSVERYNSPCCRMLHQSRGQKQFLEKAVSIEAYNTQILF